MARVPVPPVPSTLVDLIVASRPRRGAAVVLPITAADGPEDGESGAPRIVCTLDGAELADDWRPAAAVTAGKGEVHQLPGSRWLVGIGPDAADPKAWRSAGAALVRAVNADIAARSKQGENPPRTVQITVDDEVAAECIAAFALGVRLGGYRFRVTEKDPDPSLRTLVVLTPDERLATVAESVAQAAELASATALTRDLVNTPSNVKNPQWLAHTAEKVAAPVPGLEVTVRDEAWLAAQGFGGILAVGGGSASPPRLIELRYRPRGAGTHLLLVGKGITFDTGGLSLKPAEGMHLMRTDMSGGAAVIAALRAIAHQKLPVKVTGLVPCAENHVSGSSYRPGDIVTHYGGQTTEIDNTDAEGRLVLADAIAYGVRKFAPDAVIDIATLTGAMKVALGVRIGGLFTNDDDLSARLLDAADRAGEPLWRMPLLDAHADAVTDSALADLCQAPKGPGGITAALFLRAFTDGLPWAHLDIAGPARADKPYDDVTPGGTGFGARALVELVASYA